MMDLEKMARLEKMAELWKKGHSQTQIAAMFNVTRQSVAGDIFRHRDMFARRNKVGAVGVANRLLLRAEADVTHSPRISKPRKPQEARKPDAETQDRAMAKRVPAVVYEPVSKAETEAYDLSRIPHAKSLMEIGACECRWWVSEGPIMFCAEVTVDGSSWCEHHKRRSVGRGTDSERKAVSDARRAA